MGACFCHTDVIGLALSPYISTRKVLHLHHNEEIIHT